MQDLLTRLGFAAGHLTYVLCLGLVAYLIGRAAMSRARFTSAWEEASVSTAVGLGALAHLLLALGLVGLLHRWAVLAALTIWLTVIRRTLLLHVRRWVSTVRAARWQRVLGLAALALGVGAPVWLLALYPPTSWDATEYYLAASKLYVAEHAILPTPHLRFEVYPQLNHMLFTLGLMFWDEVAAQLAPLLMMLTACAALVASGVRGGFRHAGWWAAATLVGNPLLVWIGTNAYADMGVTLFVTVAAYALWTWFAERDEHWLMVAAAACGFAASAKYTAAPFIVAAGVAVLFVSIARRRIRPLLLFAAVALALGAPWYLWNAYHTGNPFYPMLADVFGYGNLNEDDVRRMMNDVRGRGIGRSLSALASFPQRLLLERWQFAAEAPLSPLLVIAFPLVVLHAVRDAGARVMVSAIGAYTLLWFYSGQILRHLVPVIPVASFATAAALEAVTRRLRWSDARWGHVAAPLAVALALLAPGWSWALREARARGPLPTTQQTRAAYLAREKPSYPAYAFLNEKYGHAYAVYALMDEDMPYFAEGRFMGDWFGPARFSRVTSKLNDAKALHRELRALGAGFFLVNTRRFTQPLPADDFWNSHFEPIHESAGTLLFRIADEPLRRELGPNLLLNAGFDHAPDGRPEFWEPSGTPGLVTQEDGGNAARCTGETNVFAQRVAIRSGAVYALAFRARTTWTGVPHHARIQINFSDDDGRLVHAHVDVMDVDDTWRRFAGVIVAPRDARTGTVYASPHGTSEVLFDDFTLVEVSYSPAP